MKKMRIILAGILLIPAFSFSSESDWLYLRDRLTTPVLNRISRAPWMESRFYSDLPKERQLSKMLEDFAFECWLAQKAKSEGFQLSPEERSWISAREKEIEYELAHKFLSRKVNVSEEYIARLSPSWTSPLPEKWEVFYIFIDDSGASSISEKLELEKRALWLKERLTPENFQDMAQLWSDSPDSADGGALGAINLDRMGPTFSSQIKKTPVGTIVGPYRTTSGWNIFYVRSHTPSKERKLSPEKLREMTAENLANMTLQEIFNSSEKWLSLMQELGIIEHPEIKAEILVLENYLLSKGYIRKKAKEQIPTEGQIRQIYAEKASLFVLPPTRKAREILISSKDWSRGKTREEWIARRKVRNMARDLRERIMQGEDFSYLAKKHSISKTASSGGELGWIQEPSSFLYDMNLGKLKIGEISPPIATDKGYLLLQLVEEKRDQTLPFDEAREKCVNLWYGEMESEIREKLYKTFMD
ncbi:peptidylprolyl isomerase [Candidatus Sumerlaeota bacterium]|nr:peptidylprolyl isomerase [Candidatus Sumerlaeota bacterium]